MNDLLSTNRMAEATLVEAARVPSLDLVSRSSSESADTRVVSPSAHRFDTIGGVDSLFFDAVSGADVVPFAIVAGPDALPFSTMGSTGRASHDAVGGADSMSFDVVGGRNRS